MHPARLFVLCGLPGSGKTPRALDLAERFRATRMSADDVMGSIGVDLWDSEARASIEAHQRSITVALLRAGQSVVVEWGSWKRTERDELLAAAGAAGALAHLEYLDAPVDLLWERVDARGLEAGLGGRPITRRDLERWATEIEPPSVDELARYDPWPPVRAGEHPASPAFPYGSWRP